MKANTRQFAAHSLSRPSLQALTLCVTGLTAIGIHSACSHAKPALTRFPEPCSVEDRNALLVGALQDAVSTTASTTGARCVVVAVGDQEPRVELPNSVLYRLRRIVHTRVVALRDARNCLDGPHLWVGEPLCNGEWGQVRNEFHDHCPMVFRRTGTRWDVIPTGACE